MTFVEASALTRLVEIVLVVVVELTVEAALWFRVLKEVANDVSEKNEIENGNLKLNAKVNASVHGDVRDGD